MFLFDLKYFFKVNMILDAINQAENGSVDTDENPQEEDKNDTDEDKKDEPESDPKERQKILI